MVAALTLDLKNSQKYDYKKRADIQKYLIDIVDIMNHVFRASLLRDLRFNGGDEMQGLFQDPENAFLCLRLFQHSLHNIPFHAGIGIGEWTTVIDDKDTFYQDGTAYHRARRAIDLSKKEKEYTAIICSETNRDPILNSMLNSCFQLTNKSITSQKALILLLELCYPIQASTSMNTDLLSDLLSLVSGSYTGVQNIVLSESIETYNDIIEQYQLWDKSDPDMSSTNTSHNLIFPDAHPFGAAKRLADISGSTRQNIDKALHTSNVYTERALALALLSELRSFSSDKTPDKEA